MAGFIKDILYAPVNSTSLLIISILYAIVESIRIYDARLIQAKTRGFYSGVAISAKGRFLPKWVGYFHALGWLLLIIIVIINWKYAIAFYIILFLLRVLPILERIGAVIMSPFLKEEENDINGDIT